MRVLETLNTPVPEGFSRWDAPHFNVKIGLVRRVLKAEGISLHRQRSWRISTDKDFAAKAADIVGIYLHLPLNAVVLCVDEKIEYSGIRTKGGVHSDI